MANPEHVEIVKQGAEAIKKWRKEQRDERQGEKLDLSEAQLGKVNLQGVEMYNTNFQKASLHHANFQKAYLGGANFQGANLAWADFQRADLREVNFQGANLRMTNLRGAWLRAANLSETILTRVRGADRAVDLGRVRLEGGDALYFDECQLTSLESFFDWERLKTVGRLPLFGVSYTVLILIPIFFYGLAFYNNKVASIRAWAETVGTTADHPLHPVTTLLLATLHPQPIPSLSLDLLVSTVLLAMGSTLFTLFCPSRIREFSRDQWCDQMQRSLLHYRPLSWKYRGIRLVCAACYALGGIGVLWVIANKLWSVARFICDNSTISSIWW